MKRLPFFRKYVCVRQRDETDCGAACLATVAKTHGLNVAVSEIRESASTDRQGTTMLGLVAAGRRLGFEARGVRVHAASLPSLPAPFIAHVVLGPLHHFVVVHQAGAKSIVVADPARGLVPQSVESFCASWTGALVLLLPGPSFRPGRRSQTVWRRFARLLEPNDYLLGELFGVSLIVMLLGLAVSLYLQLLVDRVLIRKDIPLLRWLTLGLLGVVLLKAAYGGLRGILQAYLSRRVDIALLGHSYEHLLRLPMRFYETRQVGDILTRFSDAARIRDLVSGATLFLLLDTATVLSAIALLAWWSPRLALFGLAIFPPVILVVAALNRPLRRAQRHVMEQAAVVQSCVVESVTAAAALKALDATSAAARLGLEKIAKLLSRAFHASLWATAGIGAGELLVGLGLTAILYSAALMSIEGSLTTGSVVAVFTVLSFMTQPVVRLLGVSQLVQDAVVAAERLGEVLDLEPEPEGRSFSTGGPHPYPADLCLRSVTFAYGSRGTVLKDVTLEVPFGSTMGIVGSTGGGKSTLAKLLLKFYEPTGGSIEIGGCNLRDAEPEAVRRIVGYVEQSPALVTGTIEENLRFYDREISMEEIREMAAAVGLADFIESLPSGYQTFLGDRGLLLSGGQQQLLVIARTLLRRPTILILDEATSHLDSLAESKLQALLRQLKGKKTIILIAHRLCTVWLSDELIVLEEGHVAERGTHERLLRADGRYAAMWREQALAGQRVSP